MNPASNDDSKNVLNSDVELHGTLRFSGELSFDGKLDGDVSSEIKAKTELFGDIRASRLVIEEGVTFVGQSEVNPSKAFPTAPPQPRTVDGSRAAPPARPAGA